MLKKSFSVASIILLLSAYSFEASSAQQKVKIQAVAVSKGTSGLFSDNKFTCAIRNFELWCWGSETNQGHLGIDDGDNVFGSDIASLSPDAPEPYFQFLDVLNPVNISRRSGLAGKKVTDLSLGREHGCVIADSAAYCWGRGHNGLLGIDGLESYANNAFRFTSPNPVPVFANGVLKGKKVTAISAGTDHSCAVAGGKAFCWGAKINSGELGDGNDEGAEVGRSGHSLPVAVRDDGVLKGKEITDISVGEFFTCVIADGSVYCWGEVGAALGLESSYLDSDGDVVPRSSLEPVAVSTSGALKGKRVTEIAVGNIHACAIAEGKSYCWGLNRDGLLGLGVKDCKPASSYPFKLREGAKCLYPPISPVLEKGALLGKQITSLSVSQNDTTCVVADHMGYCWGYSLYGSLGNGKFAENLLKPRKIVSTGTLSDQKVRLISQDSHGCAATDFDIYCWGPAILGDGGSLSHYPLAHFYSPRKVDFVAQEKLKIIECVNPKYPKSQYLSRVIGKSPKCEQGLVLAQSRKFN